MLWKGNFAGESIEDGFARVVESRLYEGTSVGTASAINSTAATAISTATIPANTLLAGDILRLKGAVIVTAINATPNLTVKLKFGGGTTLATGALSMIVDDLVYWEYNMRVNNLDSASLVQFDEHGSMFYWEEGAALSGTNPVRSDMDAKFQSPGGGLASNADIACLVEFTWSVAHASNTAVVIQHQVDLVRP